MIVLSFSFQSCQKIDDGEFVEPITIFEKIKGDWTLSSLTYVDDYAKSINLEPYEYNLSGWFNFDNLSISLSVDDNNKPTSFLINGSVPEIIPLNGFWNLSSPYPSTNLEPLLINLYDDAQNNNLIGTLNLTSIPGANNFMEIRLIHSSSQLPFSTYVFKFYPSN